MLTFCRRAHGRQRRSSVLDNVFRGQGQVRSFRLFSFLVQSAPND